MGDDDDIACLIGSHNFRGKTIDITRGDYSDLMKRLVDNLQSAKVMPEVNVDLLLSSLLCICVGECMHYCMVQKLHGNKILQLASKKLMEFLILRKFSFKLDVIVIFSRYPSSLQILILWFYH